MNSGIQFNLLLWKIWQDHEEAPMEEILLSWSHAMVNHDVRLRTLNEMDGEGETYNYIQDHHEGNIREAFAEQINSIANYNNFPNFNHYCNQYLNYKSLK